MCTPGQSFWIVLEGSVPFLTPPARLALPHPSGRSSLPPLLGTASSVCLENALQFSHWHSPRFPPQACPSVCLCTAGLLLQQAALAGMASALPPHLSALRHMVVLGASRGREWHQVQPLWVLTLTVCAAEHACTRAHTHMRAGVGAGKCASGEEGGREAGITRA